MMKPVYILSIVVLLISCRQEEKTGSPVSVSGIYPHLAMYNVRPFDGGVGETGVGAIVPWADRLWVMTYSASHPVGGADKLYELDSNLTMTVRPESIGGTHANRMIHKESNQLIIGPYFIDKDRNVRSVPSSEMSGRLTGVARHLTDPKNKVYYFAMEEGFYEVDVNDLSVKTLYEDGYLVKPSRQVLDREHIFGTHGKGAYSGQGRVVVSNNGIRYWTEASAAKEGTGSLGEWDGTKWRDVDKKQYVEVTGPGGIYGNENESDAIWATGWDDRSVILKVLEGGQWYEYRMPKASFTYDGLHGHFTEWPRIRDIDNGRKLMTMHGMFWEFPADFSIGKSSGIKPLSSYLKIIPDFSMWGDRLVIGADDASTFENPLVGRPQSNLWFIKPEELTSFGPRNGFGGVWVNNDIRKNETSSPFLIEGFDQRALHLSHRSGTAVTFAVEIDREGDGKWMPYQEITVPAGGYVYLIFPSDFEGTWVRLRSNANARSVIAYFFMSQDDQRKAGENPSIFSSLPSIDNAEPRTYGLVRAGASDDITLQYVAYEERDGKASPLGYYEVDGDMKIARVQNDTIGQWLTDRIEIKADYRVDDASVIVQDDDGKIFRLPKGMDGQHGIQRGIREVVTERSLFNCHGTIYELPRHSAGGVAGIKPISTHNRMIYDFCSWRGMMVISGNLVNARNNGNYFTSEDGKTGLWFGTIDDLWKFGKPAGHGGPWLNTEVKANQPSDPYLMTGYDQKEMSLSHKAKAPVTFTVEVDLTSYGDWKKFDDFVVKPGETLRYEFPEGYSAHWVRLKTNAACTASAQFEYK